MIKYLLCPNTSLFLFYNRSLETWFRCIDKFIAAKVLSISVYTATMHHLHHLPQIIEQCSALRNISVRSLEREIGNYKKKMRARVNVDKNAVNVLEQITHYKFLESTKMMDFSILYNRNPEYNRKGFIEHPAAANDLNSVYPQLWQPFGDSILVSNENSTSTSIDGLITMNTFIMALGGYKRRYLGISKGQPISLNIDRIIVPTAKLWFDAHLIKSALFKSKLNFSANERGGEYIMFESNIRKR